jgi:hypothetical protein
MFEERRYISLMSLNLASSKSGSSVILNDATPIRTKLFLKQRGLVVSSGLPRTKLQI